MNLLRVEKNDQIYREKFGDTSVQGFDVYTKSDDRIGKIVDVLVDSSYRTYQLAVETRGLGQSKTVLLPLEQYQIDRAGQRVYLNGIDRTSLANRPIYDPKQVGQPTEIHSTEVRQDQVYPLQVETMTPLEGYVAPLEESLPLDIPVLFYQDQVYQTQMLADREHVIATNPEVGVVDGDRLAPSPLEKVDQITTSIAETETIRLLEERLVVNQRRRKVGEVIVRKTVETEIQTVEVPVRREKLIVEQISPERRQLASIDLGQGNIPGVELADITQVASSNGIENVSIPVDVARHILREVLTSADYRNTQVTLVFDDSRLQTMYKRWIERYLASRPSSV